MHCSYAYMTFALQERCAAADTISLVAQMLHRSKAHFQSMLLQKNAAIVEDFYVHLVCIWCHHLEVCLTREKEVIVWIRGSGLGPA